MIKTAKNASVERRAERRVEAQLDRVIKLVKEVSGIDLQGGKRQLIESRLAKRLRALDLSDLDEYVSHVESDSTGAELTCMLDSLSTNVTHFFRESDHFDYLGATLIPKLVARQAGAKKKLRIWSAGCSSGEEPYSIGIVLKHKMADLAHWDVKILATDLSTTILQRAMRGQYKASQLDKMPPQWKKQDFSKIQVAGDTVYQIDPSIRRMVTFGHVNLMKNWPMNGPFDAIFCRNVMIYFDKPTRERLVQRFRNLLSHGGTLFIGHSESLGPSAQKFHYVQPMVYERQ